MINTWCSIEHDNFARWHFKGLEIYDVKALKIFTAQFLTLGEKHETFTLSLDESYKKATPQTSTYLEQLDEQYKESGKYWSLNSTALNSQSIYSEKNVPSDLFFYQKTALWVYNQLGNIEKVYVNDSSIILKELNPADDLTEQDKKFGYLENMPPIYIPSVGFNKKEGVRFSIHLYTNIYFSEIQPYLNISNELTDKNHRIDNSELAHNNATKFNAWFTEVKQLVASYNGIVETDNSAGLPKSHKEHFNLNGIVLNP